MPVSSFWSASVIAFARSAPISEEVLQHILLPFFQLVGCYAHAKTELCIVLKKWIRPCRSAAIGILWPTVLSAGAAINRSATGSIGNNHAVAKTVDWLISRMASRTGRSMHRWTQTMDGGIATLSLYPLLHYARLKPSGSPRKNS